MTKRAIDRRLTAIEQRLAPAACQVVNVTYTWVDDSGRELMAAETGPRVKDADE